MALSPFTLLSKHHHCLFPEFFHLLKLMLCSHEIITRHSFLPPAQGSSMLEQVSEFHSFFFFFLGLNVSSWYVYATLSLSIHLLMTHLWAVMTSTALNFGAFDQLTSKIAAAPLSSFHPPSPCPVPLQVQTVSVLLL